MKACGETCQECLSILLVFKIAEWCLKIKQIALFLADGNVDGEKLDMFFMFSTFCFIVTAVGEAMSSIT